MINSLLRFSTIEKRTRRRNNSIKTDLRAISSREKRRTKLAYHFRVVKTVEHLNTRIDSVTFWRLSNRTIHRKYFFFFSFLFYCEKLIKSFNFGWYSFRNGVVYLRSLLHWNFHSWSLVQHELHYVRFVPSANHHSGSSCRRAHYLMFNYYMLRFGIYDGYNLFCFPHLNQIKEQSSGRDQWKHINFA